MYVFMVAMCQWRLQPRQTDVVAWSGDAADRQHHSQTWVSHTRWEIHAEWATLQQAFVHVCAHAALPPLLLALLRARCSPVQTTLITFAIDGDGMVNYAWAVCFAVAAEEMRQRAWIRSSAADLGGHWEEEGIHHSDTWILWGEVCARVCVCVCVSAWTVILTLLSFQSK